MFRNLGILIAASVSLLGIFTTDVKAVTWRSSKAKAHQLHSVSATERKNRRNFNQTTDCDDYRFQTNKTTPYLVDHLPDLDFDYGEMYAGQIPINNSDPSRNLFFIFQPKIGKPVDEITIWFNGGPGCSSLEGFLQENGQFIWTWGQYNGLENPYSWVNLTNMLWVEYPVGVGFSTGTVTATSEEEIAQDFIHFFKNFQKIFGISNFKIYVTGESYAGRYVPYVSAAMLDQNDTTHYDISGLLVYDPCIGNCGYIHQTVPAVPYVEKYSEFFMFNSSYMATIKQAHQDCGYADWIATYLKYPPPGLQPPAPPQYNTESPSCDLWDLVQNAALQNNPCFNPYEISDTCPILFDPLSFPTVLVYNYPEFDGPYFNRADVKKALHVSNDITWAECANNPVFVDGNDFSADPIQSVLPKLIEHTNRVLVANGDYDYEIINDGTLLAIQNMTWNGLLGFQKKPSQEIIIDLPDLQWAPVFAANGLAGVDGPGQGTMGVQHYERGLLFARTFQSGHMEPQFQPRVAYRHLQWVLGRIDSL